MVRLGMQELLILGIVGLIALPVVGGVVALVVVLGRNKKGRTQ